MIVKNITSMDESRFTPNKSGELLPIETPDGSDFAFIPNPLPPPWQFDPILWPLLADAREQLVLLDQKGRTFPNPGLLITPLQSREAIKSSRLEGTDITARDFLLFEFKQEPETERGADSAGDSREVANYSRSLRKGFDRIQEERETGNGLSLDLVRDMHRILTTGVRGREKNPGEFRQRQVHVGSGRRYLPPPPGPHLLSALAQFEVALRNRPESLHPLVWSYVVHYQFEAIHPFTDGNGRVGRALLALTTFYWCKLFLPWLYMSAYFERYKDEYIDNLFRVSTHGDWTRWIEFCLRGTIEQCKDAIARCEAFEAVRARIHKEGDDISPRMPQLLERIFEYPVFQTKTVAQWCKTSLPTARAYVDALVAKGLVKHLEGNRPRVFYAPMVLEAMFDPEDFPSRPGHD